MKIDKLNLCYYPTSIVLVDDDENYLVSLKNAIKPYYPLNSFLSAKEALTHFKNKYKEPNFIQRCSSTDEDINTDYVARNFNIRKLHQEIYNQGRFNEESVIIVDYAMPDMTGVEFSRLLKKQCAHVKIIMLTGEADENLAVQAFNEGIIDAFFIKARKGLFALLLQKIYELQEKFFFDITDKLLDKGIKNKKFTFLNDLAFIEIFNTMCEKNKIVEYYLVDSSGSFMLVNDIGVINWLAVTNDEQMKNYLEFAEIEDAPKEVLSALRNKKWLPFFPTEKDQQVGPSAWAEYLHPVTQLQGKEVYYYAYINNQTRELEGRDIESYQSFLNKQ